MMANVKLASAGEDIKVWDPSNYSLQHEYLPHSSNVADISWSHDGHFLASACTNGDKISVAFTKLETFNLADLAQNLEQDCVSFSRTTSRNLLTSGKSGEIKLWDLKMYQLKKSYTGHIAPVTKVQFNWNDSVILSGNVRGDIILHNVTTGMASSPLRSPKVQAIRDLKYSVIRRSLFASASDDGIINLWDANARHIVHAFKEAHGAPATSLAFSPVNEMLLASVGLDKKIICFDVKAKTPIRTLPGDQSYTAIDFFHDGYTLVVGTIRGKVIVYDLRQTTSPTRSFVAHKTSVQRLSFQPVKNLSQKHGTSNSNRSASLSPKRLLSNTHHAASSSSVVTTSGTASLIPQLASKPIIKKCFEVNSQNLSNGIPPTVDPLGTGDVSSHDSYNKLRNLSDDIFSPLRDDSSFEKPVSNIRKQPIGAGTSKLFLGDRPITAGLEDGEGMGNLNGNVSDLITRQLSPTPAPRRRSASFSPRTSRNLFQERRQENSILLLPDSFTPETNTLSPTLKPPVSQIKREVSASCSLPDTLLPLATAAAVSLHSSSPQMIQSTSSTGDSALVSEGTRKEESLQLLVKDSFEDLEDLINRKVMELRVDMLKEFHIQKAEIEALFQRYSVNDDLVSENERLREEIRRLQAKF